MKNSVTTFEATKIFSTDTIKIKIENPNLFEKIREFNGHFETVNRFWPIFGNLNFERSKFLIP